MVLSLSRYHQATRNLKRKQTTRQPCRHRLCRWEARHPSQMDGFHKIQANDAQKLIHGYNGMLCHVCRHAICCDKCGVSINYPRYFKLLPGQNNCEQTTYDLCGACHKELCGLERREFQQCKCHPPATMNSSGVWDAPWQGFIHENKDSAIEK